MTVYFKIFYFFCPLLRRILMRALIIFMMMLPRRREPRERDHILIMQLVSQSALYHNKFWGMWTY